MADAGNKLAALNAAELDKNIGIQDRVDIAKEKSRIQQTAISQLQQYDNMLSQGRAANPGTNAEQRRTQAQEWAAAGVAPEDAFTFTDSAPAQLQTGVAPGGLPIFTLPRKRTA